MNTPTLSQLADIGAAAALHSSQGVVIFVDSRSSGWGRDASAREAFVRAVLDAVGYKHPEREAFDAWVKERGWESAVFLDDAYIVWKAGRAALDKQPAPETFEALDKQPAPETFEAHGLTWLKHTPGDPCPCDGEVVVQLLCDAGGLSRSWGTISAAKKIGWGASNIIGWRYADTP